MATESLSALLPDAPAPEPPLQETVRKERSRLLAFIRNRIPDRDAAEDLVQDVFYELIEAYQLAKPIERVASWLYAVARNKITDWYRRPAYSRQVSLNPSPSADEEDSEWLLAEFLPSVEGTAPDDLMRETVMDALAEALDELPPEQRDVFVRHELDGQPFRDMSEELGVPLNTLLSRKRYAVLYLRERLREVYEEWLLDE
jgi:RNA polymerase sigma factor (sigma-70 family)